MPGANDHDDIDAARFASQPAVSIQVRQSDILLGRGNTVRRHAGNIHFRNLVHARKSDFFKARRGSQETRAIAVEIVRSIQGLGGRFLQYAGRSDIALQDIQSETTLQWTKVDDEVAIKKTLQLFRDIRKDTPSSSRPKAKGSSKKAKSGSNDSETSDDDNEWDDNHSSEESAASHSADETDEDDILPPRPVEHGRTASALMADETIRIEQQRESISIASAAVPQGQEEERQSSETETRSVVRVTPLDIIVGPGTDTILQQAYNAVAQYRDLARHLSFKYSKDGRGSSEVAVEMVQIIKARGGRFLCRQEFANDKDAGRWMEVADDIAISEAEHLFCGARKSQQDRLGQRKETIVVNNNSIDDAGISKHAQEERSLTTGMTRHSQMESNPLKRPHPQVASSPIRPRARLDDSHANRGKADSFRTSPINRTDGLRSNAGWHHPEPGREEKLPATSQQAVASNSRLSHEHKEKERELLVSPIEIDLLRGVGLCGLPVWTMKENDETFITGPTDNQRFKWRDLSMACKSKIRIRAKTSFEQAEMDAMRGSMLPRSFALRLIMLLEKIIIVAYQTTRTTRNGAVAVTETITPVVSWFHNELCRWASTLDVIDEYRNGRPIAYSAEDESTSQTDSTDDRLALVRTLTGDTCRSIIVMAANLSRLRSILECAKIAALVTDVNASLMSHTHGVVGGLEETVAADAHLLDNFSRHGYMAFNVEYDQPEQAKDAARQRFEWLVEQLHHRVS